MSFTRLVDKTSFLFKVLVLKKFLIIIGEVVLLKPSVLGCRLAATPLYEAYGSKEKNID